MNHGNLQDVENPLLATKNNSKPSRFRTALPQVIVSVVTTFLFLDYGVSVSYPTVVISALTGLNNETNPNEFIKMTAVETSWLGSITYLGKLFGSIVCGFASEQFGRRNSMLLINIPLFITFGLYYYSDSVSEVFIASILLGFSTGFLKAPSSTYIAETSEVSIRGVLSSITTFTMTGGSLIVFILGNLTQWRNIALYCFVLQAAITIALYFVPESPIWLLSRGREKAAFKSLQWLRGWMDSTNVQQEFESMKRYKKATESCVACKRAEIKCTHLNKQSFGKAFKELARKKTLKPLCILAVMGFAAYFAGTHHLVAYMVQILHTYRSTISPNLATVVVSITGLVAAFATPFVLKLTGKRKLFMLALLGMTLSTLALSVYGFKYLPPNSKSFSQKIQQPLINHSDTSAIPLIAFCSMHFFTTVAITVPYAMLSELFSMKSRSMATAVSTTVHNIFAFASTKSFYNIENWLGLPGALGVYCFIGVVSLIVMYFILPETEGRTLEDIDDHFSDNQLKLTDRYIVKRSSIASNVVAT